MARTDNAESDRDNNSGDCDLLDLGNDAQTTEGPPTRGSTTLSPPIVSNRPIGSGRSRSRSRHRHRHRRSGNSRIMRFKRKESNFIAAICSMVVLVLLCTALAEPQWFFLSGGGCRDRKGNEINYIGVNQFFYMGGFVPFAGAHTSTAYKYGPKYEEVLVDCVTAQVVSIMKSIISLSLFGIVLSLAAFLLDLTGPTHKLLKVNRRHGILNILTVGFCVVINGFCYWATEVLDAFQHRNKLHTGSKVRVEFSVSFFLVTAAGAMSVIAAACNLLRRHGSTSSQSSSSMSREHEYDTENLLDDYDRQEFGPLDMSQSMTCLPPPPPYSP